MSRMPVLAWRLLGIMLLALACRVVFFTGYHGFDDVAYIKRAYDLSQGTITVPVSHWEARLGLVGPTAMAYRLLGVSPGTTVLWPLVCSLLTVAAAFVLGRRLLGASVGLLSALLVALFPFDVIFASVLFPTGPVALLCGVGYGLFLLGEAERAPRWWYLAAGISFGLACVTHEVAIIAVAFYPVHVAFGGEFRRGHLLAAIGLVLALGLDPLVHGWMGNAWARIDVLSHADTAQGTAADVAYKGLNASWITEPVIRLLTERTFGLLPWFIAPVALLRALRPKAALHRPLAIILIAVFLWTEYGTMSLRAYAPLARLPRYLSPLTLPALWLLADYLTTLRARPRLIALPALTISAVVCLLMDSGNQLYPYQGLRTVLARERPAVVSVEAADAFPLRFAERFRPAYQLSVLTADSPVSGLVVAKSALARQLVERIDGVRQVAEVHRDPSVYRQLLAQPVVHDLLRLVRPPERFQEYAAKAAPESWRVYRVP